jgi:type IV pilus assembly protein PilV
VHPSSLTRGAPGFTLVEVLVALVVLAVGLLGIGVLLVASLQSSRLALQRTAAVLLAADMADRIRANRAGGPAYALADATLVPPPPKACTAAAGCSAAEISASELYDWQQAVVRALPDATTVITVTPGAAAASVIYTISVAWAQSDTLPPAAVRLTVQT